MLGWNILPKFKREMSYLKMWRASKYDCHPMYENYSQRKTDSLEITRMTSLRQNC